MAELAASALLADAAAMEVADVDCAIEGNMPGELRGAFFRLGGFWAFPPKYRDDIPLHADGFISRFRVADGQVSYSGRFVETDRLKANRQAGRMRFGYYRNRTTDDEGLAEISASAANTSAFSFAGRVMALKEDGRPYEIDPVTLETRGIYDFGGALDSETFTAHPVIDGVTGELVTLGYQATGPFSKDVFIYVFWPDGTLRHRIAIEMPWLDMIHDMAITKDHIILLPSGYTIYQDRLPKGGPLWSWDPQSPSRIGVLSRTGDGSDLRWFTGPKLCMLHKFNAYAEGSRITLDAPFYRGNPFPFLPSIDGADWRAESGEAVLRRIRIDFAGLRDEWSGEALSETIIGDLGDVDPRCNGHRHRYCFGGHEFPPAPSEDVPDFRRPPWPIANSYVRFDVETGEEKFLRLPSHMSLAECVFVPKTSDAREGEGFLVGTASDLATGGCHLVVADAERLEEGPLAMARLPVKAGPQVHGCWVAEGDMQLD